MKKKKWLVASVYIMCIIWGSLTSVLGMFTESYTMLDSVCHIDVSHTIEGKVVDEGGEPLIAVNVQVQGTTTGTATDFDGMFVLEGIDEDAGLVISYVGYQRQEVALEGQTSIEIVMISDSELLDEIVVVGYGTMRQKDLTGAISTINAEDLKVESPRSVQDLLRGNTAGLSIGFANSAKGSAGLQMRGQNTLKAGSEPLS